MRERQKEEERGRLMNNYFEYILVKDPHFKFSFKNGIRKPGWERDIDDKIYQIITYMTNNNIKNLFFTGDVFDKSRKKDWSLNQFQANKERLRRFKDAGIVVYSNAGNHDYFLGAETIEGTAFGEMVDLGLLNYIGTGMEPIQFQVGDVGEVLLFGVDYHVSTAKVLDEIQQVSAYPRGQQSSKLLLMHSNVTSDTTQLTDFTYGQLAGYDIDIFNLGHYHLVPKGGAVQEFNNTHFLNPWNLTRVTRDYDVKLDSHRPEFIHTRITFLPESDPIYDFKEVFLNVKKFSETFNIDVINMLQELGKDRFEFFKNVDLKLNDDLSDDEKLMVEIAKTHNITENSIKIAKELL